MVEERDILYTLLIVILIIQGGILVELHLTREAVSNIQIETITQPPSPTAPQVTSSKTPSPPQTTTHSQTKPTTPPIPQNTTSPITNTTTTTQLNTTTEAPVENPYIREAKIYQELDQNDLNGNNKRDEIIYDLAVYFHNPTTRNITIYGGVIGNVYGMMEKPETIPPNQTTWVHVYFFDLTLPAGTTVDFTLQAGNNQTINGTAKIEYP